MGAETDIQKCKDLWKACQWFHTVNGGAVIWSQISHSKAFLAGPVSDQVGLCPLQRGPVCPVGSSLPAIAGDVRLWKTLPDFCAGQGPWKGKWTNLWWELRWAWWMGVPKGSWKIRPGKRAGGIRKRGPSVSLHGTFPGPVTSCTFRRWGRRPKGKNWVACSSRALLWNHH